MYRNTVNNVAPGSVGRSRLVEMLLRGRPNQNNGTIAGGLAHAVDQFARGLNANRLAQAEQLQQQQETEATNAMVSGMAAKQWSPPTGEQVFKGDAPGAPELTREEMAAVAAPAGGYAGAISAVQGLGTPASGRLASKLLMSQAERDMQRADLMDLRKYDASVRDDERAFDAAQMDRRFGQQMTMFERQQAADRAQRDAQFAQQMQLQDARLNAPKPVGDPIQVTDAQGKPALLQQYSDGTTKPVSLGDGYSMAPPSSFAGNSMDAQTYNILLKGDPASPEYAAAYSYVSRPKTEFDPQSGKLISVQPDMSAFRRPASMGQGGPMVAGGAPGAMGQPMPAGQPGQMPIAPTSQPGGSQVSVTQAAPPQNTKVTGENAGRIGLAVDATAQLTDDVIDFVRQGGLTGLYDYTVGVLGNRGKAGTVNREITAASEAMTRLLTGAGMNAAEAEREVRSYLPAATDDGPTAANKLVQLRRRLNSVVNVMTNGLPPGGTPGASGQSAAILDHSQFTDDQLMAAPVGTTVIGPDGALERKAADGGWQKVQPGQQDAMRAMQTGPGLGAR